MLKSVIQVNRFHSGIDEAQELLKSVDFANIDEKLPELYVIKHFLTLLQHTSYHLFQIVTIRKILGDILVGSITTDKVTGL